MIELNNQIRGINNKLTQPLNLGNEKNQILQNLDKKVVVKELRERGKNKTFIQGLNLYDEFKEIDNLKKFIKEIKEKFACGCTIVTNDNQQKLLLQGNHKDNITKFIKEKYSKIKIE